MQELFDENEGGRPVLGKTVASGQLPVVSRKMLGLKLSLVSAVPGGTPIRKTSWARIRRTARRDWTVVGSSSIGVPGIHPA